MLIVFLCAMLPPYTLFPSAPVGYTLRQTVYVQRLNQSLDDNRRDGKRRLVKQGAEAIIAAVVFCRIAGEHWRNGVTYAIRRRVDVVVNRIAKAGAGAILTV